MQPDVATTDRLCAVPILTDVRSKRYRDGPVVGGCRDQLLVYVSLQTWVRRARPTVCHSRHWPVPASARRRLLLVRSCPLSTGRYGRDDMAVPETLRRLGVDPHSRRMLEPGCQRLHGQPVLHAGSAHRELVLTALAAGDVPPDRVPLGGAV